MSDNAKHTIHYGPHHHFGWDNANPPALTVAPGETVEVETAEASGGQLTPRSTVADIAALDFEKINPVTGPLFIDGAEPGDAVKVTLLSFDQSGWGWTALIPGFGLLADQFPEPALTLWSFDAGGGTFRRPSVRVDGCRSSPSAARSAWRRARPARTASSRPGVSAGTWTSATWPPAPNSTFPSR